MYALPLLCPINKNHKNINLVSRQPTLLDVLDLCWHINRIIGYVNSGIGLVKCGCALFHPESVDQRTTSEVFFKNVQNLLFP